MALRAEAKALLLDANRRGIVTIYAQRIVAAAELIEAGYVEAQDDPEGPFVYITEKGKTHLGESEAIGKIEAR